MISNVASLTKYDVTCIAFAGIFLIPIMPIGYYAAVELSKPTSEPMSSGIIMVFGMIFGVALTYFISIMCDTDTVEAQQQNVRTCLFIMIGWLFLACFIMNWVKPIDDKNPGAERDEEESDDDDAIKKM